MKLQITLPQMWSNFAQYRSVGVSRALLAPVALGPARRALVDPSPPGPRSVSSTRVGGRARMRHRHRHGGRQPEDARGTRRSFVVAVILDARDCAPAGELLEHFEKRFGSRPLPCLSGGR